MSGLDYILVMTYLLAMLALGVRFKKSNRSTEYFLGGRSFGAFSLCMSTMATQLGAVSFISAPAFVGLRAGGGMQWLTFEFGVPLAMIVIMVLIGPMLYRSGVVSVYAFLEKRFGSTSRQLLAALFMIRSSLGAGITINVVCVVLASVVDIAFWKMMAILGIVTVVYALEGGMKAIVYSEVAQMIAKVLGIVTIVVAGLYYVGGWEGFVTHLDHARLNAVNFRNYGFDGTEYGFWPMTIGGMFLYLSYYGTDQTQAQRMLAARDEETIRRLLLMNGILRFPVTLAYCVGGLVLGSFVASNTAYSAMIPADKADLMIPMFIAHYLPHGLVAIIVIALLAAGMSSYSSAINSLSAVTMEDFLTRFKTVTKEQYVPYSKIAALGWGAVTMGFGFVAGNIAVTAIEAINKVSSVFYGPIVGMFLLAPLGRWIKPLAANVSVLVGVGVNIGLWVFCKNVFWFWWNAIGAGVTLALGVGLSLCMSRTNQIIEVTASVTYVKAPKETVILILYFLAMVCIAMLLPRLF